MEFDISYTGDAEGGYIYKNGKYETLNEDQVHLRNISDEDLISEIQRRGLSQKSTIMLSKILCHQSLLIILDLRKKRL